MELKKSFECKSLVFNFNLKKVWILSLNEKLIFKPLKPYKLYYLNFEKSLNL